MTALKAEIVEDQGALAGLADEWRRLAEARGNAFSSPEWFECSLRESPGWRARVVVVRDQGGKVVGLVPFAAGPGRIRRMLMCGPFPGDLVEPVAAAADHGRVAAAAAKALRAAHPRVTLELGNVDAGADWWRSMAVSGGLVAMAGPEEVLPYANLDGLDWDAYMATRSRSFRSQIGRKMRKLQRDRAVELRWTADHVALESDLKDLFDLHEARWSDRAGKSSFADPRQQAFHRRFAAAALDRGWLRLLIMRVDGVPSAAWYGWRLGDRFSYYQAGFDPSLADYSVGALMLAQTVERAVSEGAATYDMLLGDEPFKARMADEQRTGRRVALVAPIGVQRIRAGAEAALRRSLRRLPPSTRNRISAARASLGRRGLR